MTEKKRIGVLTGGGDAPGLNAVIRGVVRTAERVYQAEIIGILDGYAGLLERRFRQLYSADVRDILPMGGTILGASNRVNPFRFPSGDDFVDRSVEVVETIRDIGLDALVVIGGDGTMKMSREFAAMGVDLVGVPKTIDNDLAATDYTFGFWTAIETATEALDRLHDTAESHHRVMLLEVMGRDAGWIALHAGLAGAADVILIPEIPYHPESVAAKIAERRDRGQAFSLVVVAEGAIRQEGGQVIRDIDPMTGYPRLGGAGERLRGELEERIEHEVRCTVLGHLQRGGSPTPFDRILATRFGERAARAVMDGRFGRMVRLSNGIVDDVPLAEAVEKIKQVDPDGELVRTARSLGIGFGD